MAWLLRTPLRPLLLRLLVRKSGVHALRQARTPCAPTFTPRWPVKPAHGALAECTSLAGLDACQRADAAAQAAAGCTAQGAQYTR